MNARTDDDLARLLTESLIAREGDVDPDRARALARATRPAPRRWPAAVAAAAVVVIAGCITVYAADLGLDTSRPAVTHPPDVATTTRVEPDAPTTADNVRRATEVSEAVIASLPVPRGSVRLAGEPKGWPERGMFLGPADSNLTRTAWWSTPLTTEQLADFFIAHAPAGMRHPLGEDVIVAESLEGADLFSTQYSLVSSPEPRAYTGPSLLVQFLGIGDRTLLRADTFLAARSAVSTQHRVTGDVTEVRIDRVVETRHFEGRTLPTVRLVLPRDVERIRRLVTAFNALRGSGTGGGVIGCPLTSDPPPMDTVTFVTTDSSGGTSTLVAELEPSCFGQVQVTIEGTPLEVTLDPVGWDEVVDQVVNDVRRR